jgi:hypothetical protein
VPDLRIIGPYMEGYFQTQYSAAKIILTIAEIMLNPILKNITVLL